MLLSMSIHHKNSKVYGLIDTETKNSLDIIKPQLRLQLFLSITLDKYSNKNRNIMVNEGIWDEFQMQKANVIKYALENETDTMFLDSDIIFFYPINVIDKSKELGVSPHYIKKSNTDKVGYYNGGCLWTKNKNVPNDWIEFTKTSRYHDQASIEDLVKKYDTQEFGEEVNYMPWRIILSDNPSKTKSQITIANNEININNKPLIFLHTHFHDKRFVEANSIFINALKTLKRYKELLVIDRIINNKWIIKIPKQPRNGIWNHNNDSFRELASLMKQNNSDVDIHLTDSGHCWLGNDILLYDRPTHLWFNNELMSSSLILLGNGDINKEGKLIKQNNLNVSPWIFWPRRPAILENILTYKGLLSYKDRTIESIFIGNYENSQQEKYRNTQIDWSSVLTEYHCTSGNKHKFTHEEYLMKLRNSRYGLCLRGYGSKCHREVELMAFGTVPIVTPEVTVESYMEPLVENKHYITVKDEEEIVEKLKVIRESDWNLMSNACYEWYQRNVYSKQSSTNMINKILYEF
tara:strand:+ start:2317 stop:3876 length:1560 start_codon:yes stop_codon:yes gene_type:complete